MPISAYSNIRDNNASIPPGDIRSSETKDQQIINSIRQLMADLADFDAVHTFKTILNTPLTGSPATWSATGLSAFRRLRLEGTAWPATNAVSGLIRTSSNNGGAYDSGAADYLYQVLRGRAAVANAAGLSTNGIYMNDTTVISNTAGYGTWFIMDFIEFNQAAIGKFVLNSGYYGSTGVQENFVTAGFRNSAAARDALQFSFTAGNIAGGYISLKASVD